MTNPLRIGDRTKWLGLLSGAVFLGVSSYMRWQFAFESGNAGGMLLLIALIAAALTFILGILSLTRWQSFVALAIVAYSIYWLSGPTYAIGN